MFSFVSGVETESIEVTLEWSYKTDGYIVSSPTILHIEKDKQYEILIGSTDDKLYCLNNQGNEIWNFQTNSDVRSSSAIWDIDGNNQVEILFGSDNGNLYCLDIASNEIWSYTTKDNVFTSPAIADIDLDLHLK